MAAPDFDDFDLHNMNRQAGAFMPHMGQSKISTLARKAVKELMLSKKKSVKINAKVLEEFLGVPKYRYGEIERSARTVGKDVAGFCARRRDNFQSRVVHVKRTTDRRIKRQIRRLSISNRQTKTRFDGGTLDEIS